MDYQNGNQDDYQYEKREESEYQWQPYPQQGSYNLNGYPPTGLNGTPMKNRFGLKLTASILEMISCNLGSLICGIIGCVFTTKANAAYNEGRWEEFKSARKTSAIALWVGLGFFVVNLIMGIVGIIMLANYSTTSDIYNEYYDEAYLVQEQLTDEELEEYLDLYGGANVEEDVEKVVIEGEGYTSPAITIEGVAMELPVSYADLTALGFKVEDETYVINKHEYEYMSLMDSSGDYIGSVNIRNTTDAPITCAEGEVYEVNFYYSQWQNTNVEFELPNGINRKTTEEEVISILGSPDYEYNSGSADYSYNSYTWYMHEEGYYEDYRNALNITYQDGIMSSFEMSYYGWD